MKQVWTPYGVDFMFDLTEHVTLSFCLRKTGELALVRWSSGAQHLDETLKAKVVDTLWPDVETAYEAWFEVANEVRATAACGKAVRWSNVDSHERRCPKCRYEIAGRREWHKGANMTGDKELDMTMTQCPKCGVGEAAGYLVEVSTYYTSKPKFWTCKECNGENPLCNRCDGKGYTIQWLKVPQHLACSACVTEMRRKR